MNAFVLWVPGTLLVVIGAILLVLGRLDFTPAVLIIGIGFALETAGALMWIRQRKRPGAGGR